MITQCCVCRKIRSGEQWLPPDQKLDSNAQVSHGFCPDCAADAELEVAEYFRSTTAESTLSG